MSEFQLAALERVDTAVAIAVVAACLIVALLAVIAVKALRS